MELFLEAAFSRSEFIGPIVVDILSIKYYLNIDPIKYYTVSIGVYQFLWPPGLCEYPVGEVKERNHL